MAIKMLKMGLPDETILEALQLTPERINELKPQI